MRLQAGDDFGIMFGALSVPRASITWVANPALRAAAIPGASLRFEITTAISALLPDGPWAMASAMARKFDPRPESRIPRRWDSG